MGHFSRCVMMCLLATAGANQSSWAQAAQFVPIPGISSTPGCNENVCILSGSSGYSGVRVSADGAVVATLVYRPGTISGYIQRSVGRWTQSTGMRVLSPELQGLYPATGISADGSVVYGENWRWTAARGYESLLSSLSFSRTIFGCTDDGATVTGIDGRYPSEGDFFVWRIGGGEPRLQARLAEVPTGYFYFNSISGDGRVTGGSAREFDPEDSLVPTRYGAVVITDAGPQLITPVTSQAGVTDLNYDGSVAVGYVSAGFALRAFRWTQLGGLQLIEAPLGGSDSTYSRAVNANGSVIVGDYLIFGTGGSRAWVWRQGSGFSDLRNELVSEYGLGGQLAGWSLVAATDVSADGRVIVGQGINPDGYEQAFLVRFAGVPCAADFNRDGAADFFDYLDFVAAFAQSDISSDFNRDGSIDLFDYLDFVSVFATGC